MEVLRKRRASVEVEQLMAAVKMDYEFFAKFDSMFEAPLRATKRQRSLSDNVLIQHDLRERKDDIEFLQSTRERNDERNIWGGGQELSSKTRDLVCNTGSPKSARLWSQSRKISRGLWLDEHWDTTEGSGGVERSRFGSRLTRIGPPSLSEYYEYLPEKYMCPPSVYTKPSLYRDDIVGLRKGITYRGQRLGKEMFRNVKLQTMEVVEEDDEISDGDVGRRLSLNEDGIEEIVMRQSNDEYESIVGEKTKIINGELPVLKRMSYNMSDEVGRTSVKKGEAMKETTRQLEGLKMGKSMMLDGFATRRRPEYQSPNKPLTTIEEFRQSHDLSPNNQQSRFVREYGVRSKVNQETEKAKLVQKASVSTRGKSSQVKNSISIIGRNRPEEQSPVIVIDWDSPEQRKHNQVNATDNHSDNPERGLSLVIDRSIADRRPSLVIDCGNPERSIGLVIDRGNPEKRKHDRLIDRDSPERHPSLVLDRDSPEQHPNLITERRSSEQRGHISVIDRDSPERRPSLVLHNESLEQQNHDPDIHRDSSEQRSPTLVSPSSQVWPNYVITRVGSLLWLGKDVVHPITLDEIRRRVQDPENYSFQMLIAYVRHSRAKGRQFLDYWKCQPTGKASKPNVLSKLCEADAMELVDGIQDVNEEYFPGEKLARNAADIVLKDGGSTTTDKDAADREGPQELCVQDKVERIEKSRSIFKTLQKTLANSQYDEQFQTFNIASHNAGLANLKNNLKFLDGILEKIQTHIKRGHRNVAS